MMYILFSYCSLVTNNSLDVSLTNLELLQRNLSVACVLMINEDISYVVKSIQNFNQQTYKNKYLWVVLDYQDWRGFDYIVNYYKSANIISISECDTPSGCKLDQNFTNTTINIVRVHKFYSLDANTIIKQIVSFSNPDFVCEWSSLAYHDENRILNQLKLSILTDQELVLLPQIYNYNHITRQITKTRNVQYLIETAFYKSEVQFHSPSYSLKYSQHLQLADLYVLYVTFKSIINTDYVSNVEQQQIINQIGPKIEYDGILSLGTWCQTGIALVVRKLFDVHSPLHNFGIKTWENLIKVLQNRFEGYWELENMVIGKTTQDFSQHYKDVRSIYKVYDNKYNMYSNHQFDEIDNSPTELKTYSKFKEGLNKQIEIFLEQNQKYERILFVLRAMSIPMPSTIITEQHLIDLNNVLSELREGKPFDILFQVQKHQFEEVGNWAAKNGYNHFKICNYTEKWSSDYYSNEWEYLNNVRLAENHLQRLFSEILDVNTETYTTEYWQVTTEINGW
ncbi:Conserved_hypothetical protein [Hexamita inflata]|uniref:Uncharacterized protein n=1 Tax=Hexamita inflata TaxID=28002 RepID=A0ABP1H6S7_9EUKA